MAFHKWDIRTGAWGDGLMLPPPLGSIECLHVFMYSNPNNNYHNKNLCLIFIVSLPLFSPTQRMLRQDKMVIFTSKPEMLAHLVTQVTLGMYNHRTHDMILASVACMLYVVCFPPTQSDHTEVVQQRLKSCDNVSQLYSGQN